jgi:hypothetical protein
MDATTRAAYATNPYVRELVNRQQRVQELAPARKITPSTLKEKAKAMNARIRLKKLEAETPAPAPVPAPVVAPVPAPVVAAVVAAAEGTVELTEELLHVIGAKWAARRPVWKELRACGQLDEWEQVKKQLVALGYQYGKPVS